MAAVKIHLRNVDKSYELEPTDKKTSEGKTIYRNKKTGELHSELSVTLEYPEGSGNWINVPSLLNGRVYNAKGVLAMLKAGKLTPTSTHISEFDAIEAAKFRSNNLRDNVGQTLDRGLERDAIGRIIEYQPSGPHVDEPTPVIVDSTNQAMLEKIAEEKTSKQDQRSFGEKFTDAMTKVAGVAEMSYPASAKPVRGFERAESLFDVPNKIDLIHSQSARLADQEGLYDGPQHRGSERGKMMRAKQMERAMSSYQPYPTRNRAMDEAMSSYGPRFTPEMDTGTRSKVELSDITSSGPPRRSSKGISSKDNESFDIPILGNDVVTDGSKKRFKYIPHMTHEQKMKDNRSLGNATLSEYGEMPGFKKAENGNYWSADETSPFWQTDAGYEKAMQTWGKKPGWVKPGYRPKKKELDIEAIKKWFKPSK